jgi:thiosulfate dehydrogenase [quinone] large subunit
LSWLSSGWGKIQNPKWMETGESIRGFWQRAVTDPEGPANAPITYEWWRGFIQGLLDSNAHTWFGPLMAIGETLVGLGLIVGALVGIAAFFGIVMNTSFLLSGTVSSNPVFLLLGIGLVLAWKVAGWIGLDRWLLPALGTPWQRGALLRRGDSAPPPAPSTPTSS